LFAWIALQLAFVVISCFLTLRLFRLWVLASTPHISPLFLEFGTEKSRSKGGNIASTTNDGLKQGNSCSASSKNQDGLDEVSQHLITELDTPSSAP
jgi:hypothetical protein